MVLDTIIGKLNDSQFGGKNIDYVNLDWYEVNKRIHRKKTQNGIDIGIKLDDHTAQCGLNQDDVLFCDVEKVIAININPCEALSIQVDDPHMIPKVCYEIGNRHAPFFYGNNANEFIVPFDNPIKVLIEKLGVKVEVVTCTLNFNNKISSSSGGHNH